MHRGNVATFLVNCPTSSSACQCRRIDVSYDVDNEEGVTESESDDDNSAEDQSDYDGHW